MEGCAGVSEEVRERPGERFVRPEGGGEEGLGSRYAVRGRKTSESGVFEVSSSLGKERRKV